MDESWDVVILGTGLKACIMSGLLAQAKIKTLNVEKNNHYGSETASLSLDDLYAKFAPGTKAPESFGRSRNWNVDLCPKFLMGYGQLVKMLIYTDVTRYLEFMAVSGSFVVQADKVHKVPVTASEALSSGLMGFFEKRRFRNFLEWVNNYQQSKPETHQGLDATRVAARDVFRHYDLSDDCADFTGHAIALFNNDAYLGRAATELVSKAKLYADSLARYNTSPFLYPKYGLGGVPEGFARLCAINGGLQMLDKKVEGLEYGADGKVTGVKVEGTVIKCKAVLAEPGYLEDTPKVRPAEKILRSVCILKHPVPNTNDTDSCQIIIHSKQTKRQNDIYIAVASAAQAVCQKDHWIAVVSTIMEGKDDKDAERELAPAFALLGQIAQKFTWVSQRFVPTDDGTKDNVFVMSSLDATSHFETETAEVMSLYPRLTGGKTLDLDSKPAKPAEDAEADA